MMQIRRVRMMSWSLAIVSLCLLIGVGGQQRSAANVVASDVTLRTQGVKINVDDMDKAIAFYCEKLGFVIENRAAYPHEVFLQTGERVKLSLRAVKKLQRPAPTDTRVSFTLQVNDLDAAIAKMKARGVEFAESERRKEGVGYAISIRDPFGARISMMHVTIVKVEPFAEPKIYNFGFYLPSMDEGRAFYGGKLGFIERSQRYLPGDMPLGHADNSFAFMLHSRSGVQPINSLYPNALPWHTIVFETNDLKAMQQKLEKSGVKIVKAWQPKGATKPSIAFADPFGNVSEIVEVTSPDRAAS